MLELSLIGVVLLVLVLPVTVHAVERNLEAFLFFMGIVAVSLSHYLGPEPLWSAALAGEALAEPVMITVAVLVFGLVVLVLRAPLTRVIAGAERRLGSKLFCFALIAGLGIVSSIITAIMAAIVLVEVVSVLKFDKKFELRLVVLGCFSIGLGAALTPVGEPLSTICIGKLRGAPYHADFFFLLKNLGAYVLPGVIVLGVLGAVIQPAAREGRAPGLREGRAEKLNDIFARSAKVYLFIVALVLLGTGFKPVIDRYIVALPAAALYWINTLSAVMDNATLTAAEISPKMSMSQIQAVLMGLLIAGGMLIPGNIPNIISAGKLGIRSKEWAKIGLPLGFALMAAYFCVFEFVTGH